MIRPKHNGQQNRNYQNHGRNNGTGASHPKKRKAIRNVHKKKQK